MTLKSEKLVAILSVSSALTATLVLLPLILDNPALALDPKPAPGAETERHHHPLPSETVEARLAYAKTMLKITDAQTASWNAVADVVRKQAKDMDAAIEAWRKDRGTEPTALGRLERRQKFMTEAAADVGTLLDAARPLYVSLSPEQRKAADELIGRGFEGGGPHMMGHPFMQPRLPMGPDALQSEPH